MPVIPQATAAVVEALSIAVPNVDSKPPATAYPATGPPTAVAPNAIIPIAQWQIPETTNLPIQAPATALSRALKFRLYSPS